RSAVGAAAVVCSASASPESSAPPAAAPATPTAPALSSIRRVMRRLTKPEPPSASGSRTSSIVIPLCVRTPAPLFAHALAAPGEAQAGEPGEAALERYAPAGFVDDVEMLVEPDRDPRTNAPDQVVGDPALRLREWPTA